MRGQVAKMREKTLKNVSLACLIALFALFGLAIAMRFARTSDAPGAVGETAVSEGPSARFGESRERLGSYVSTLALGSGSFDGEVHRFDGNRICIETLCSASGNGAEPSPAFTVELYRLDFGLAEVPMGSRTLSTRGLSSATWEDVRPGEYFFRFSKDDDGCVLRSTNVWMYSYWEE